MSGSNFVTLGAIPDAQNDLINSATINQSGLATLVPALSGKRIFVHSLFVAAQGSIAMAAMDLSAAGATIAFPIGTIGLGGGIPLVLDFQQYPWWTIAAGDALAFSVSGQTGGRVLYVQG